MQQKIRTIRLKDKTYQKFKSLGSYYETADDILNRIMNTHEAKQKTKPKGKVEGKI